MLNAARLAIVIRASSIVRLSVSLRLHIVLLALSALLYKYPMLSVVIRTFTAIRKALLRRGSNVGDQVYWNHLD